MSEPNTPFHASVQSSASSSPASTLPAPATAAFPPAPAPRKWSAETWSTVITAICTLLTLIVAVFLGLHSMYMAEASVKALNDNLKQSNLFAIYLLNSETNKFFETNPQLSKFFEKTHRKGLTDEQLNQVFAQLDEREQNLARLGCEKIADFAQLAFLQRLRLPAEDWNNWWQGMCDQYDESPLYREYLRQRAKWYAFVDAIQPARRDLYFRQIPSP